MAISRIDSERRALLAGAVALLAGVPAFARADDALLQALRHGGVALLMRHAQTTPGVGDPPGWTFESCASQRNLDDSGIAHAERIGAWFKAQRLRPNGVRNSPWCRTRETAHLAFGRTQDWAALSNIFEDRSRADAQAAELRAFVAALKPGELVVLVSHGSMISHVSGVSPAPGEAVVVRRNADVRGDKQDAAPLSVLGRLMVP